jgi:hypothetical protein
MPLDSERLVEDLRFDLLDPWGNQVEILHIG